MEGFICPLCLQNFVNSKMLENHFKTCQIEGEKTINIDVKKLEEFELQMSEKEKIFDRFQNLGE